VIAVAKTGLAIIGSLFVGAWVGMLAEHYGASDWLGHKLFSTVFVLLVVWIL